MLDLSVVENQLMALVGNLAGSKQVSKMLVDNDLKMPLSDYIETQEGKNALELHLKYVNSINQTIAFINELLKKINALKPKEAIPDVPVEPTVQ
jgi:hypothetical protein